MTRTAWLQWVCHTGKDMTHADGCCNLFSVEGASEGDGGVEPNPASHLVHDKEDGNILDTLLHSNKAGQILVKQARQHYIVHTLALALW